MAYLRWLCLSSLVLCTCALNSQQDTFEEDTVVPETTDAFSWGEIELVEADEFISPFAAMAGERAAELNAEARAKVGSAVTQEARSYTGSAAEVFEPIGSADIQLFGNPFTGALGSATDTATTIGSAAMQRKINRLEIGEAALKDSLKPRQQKQTSSGSSVAEEEASLGSGIGAEVGSGEGQLAEAVTNSEGAFDSVFTNAGSSLEAEISSSEDAFASASEGDLISSGTGSTLKQASGSGALAEEEAGFASATADEDADEEAVIAAATAEEDAFGSEIGSSEDALASEIGSSEDAFGSEIASSEDAFGSEIGSSEDAFGSEIGSSEDALGSSEGSTRN